MNKINALFVNPWVTDFTAFDLWSKPLGLLYLASFLRKHASVNPILLDVMDRFHPMIAESGFRQKIKNYGTGPYIRIKMEKPAVLRDIPRYYSQYGMPDELVRVLLNKWKKESPPDIIFMTTLMTYWYPGARKMAEWLKNYFPDVPLVVGGIYATLMPEHARKHLPADEVISGPGEIPVLTILRKYFPGLDIITPETDEERPWPAFDLYHQLPYLVVMTSIGCPFKCTFCASPILQKKYHHRHYEAVAEEIITQTRRFSVRDVAFYDDALLVDKDRHIKPLLELLLRKKRNLRFHTPNGIHGKYLDDELAELMYKNQFKTIRISYEYFDEHRKKDITFKISNDEFVRSVEILERAGYRRKDLESYIIMGVPGQSIQDVLESMLFVHHLGIKIRLASFSPIPGTPDFSRAVELGLIEPDIDPLLCNKSIFPLFKRYYSYETYLKLRQLSNLLNEAADRNINLVKDMHLGSSFGSAVQSILTYVTNNKEKSDG